jgi:pimeloyl-ACP methyl ester carboxylesterase
MAITVSRRDLIQFGCRTAATLGVPALAGELVSGRARAQGAPGDVSREELFYRDDWFGAPWRKPEAAVLIHGNDESSIVWFGWVPRMGQEFRLIRPDLPGFGRSKVPAGFEWSLTYGIYGRFVRPIAIGIRQKDRLDFSFHNLLDHHLCHPVCDRGYPQ